MTPDEIACRLVQARDGGPKLPPSNIPDMPATLGEAYDIQRNVAQAIGSIGGFKTGRRPHAPQLMAPIFRKDVRQSPAILGRDDVDLIGIELEVGFVIVAPLPEIENPAFEAKARSCVSAVAALEVVDTRLSEIDSAPPLLRLADNQLNGALVIGEPCKNWHSLKLDTMKVKLTIGSRTVLDGVVPVPGGDAYDTFCGLARTIGPHCGGLAVGQVVITGSLNTLCFIDRGVSVNGWIDGLGDVAASFPA